MGQTTAHYLRLAAMWQLWTNRINARDANRTLFLAAVPGGNPHTGQLSEVSGGMETTGRTTANDGLLTLK
jgi:hypothetical protein